MDTDYNKLEFKDLRRKLRNNTTKAEDLLWSRLRKDQMGKRFLRQYGFRNYILDFYCPSVRLGIELDGSQHSEPERRAYDEKRTELMRIHNIKILRFWNNEVFGNIDGVLEVIKREIESIKTPPDLPLC